MTGTGAFSKGLADVTALWTAGEYDRALARVDELRRAWPGNAQLLLLRGRLIQLADHPTDTLADAKRAIQQAVELDKQAPAAAIELGHFLDNVEDDPRAAARAFAQGVSAARLALIDGLLGQAKALLQLDRREDALRGLVEAARLSDAEPAARTGPFAGRLEELLRELGQTSSV